MMGAMSINFSVANEMYLRDFTRQWGERSPVVNRAMDAWRNKQRDLKDCPTMGQLIAEDPRKALVVAMGRVSMRSRSEPTISAKDRGRITRALNQALHLMDEFMIEKDDRPDFLEVDE